MASRSKKPKFIPVDADDLKPMHRWHRPLQAPGITQVDFEERVDFRRLHEYRLARVRAGYGVGHDGVSDASVGLGVTSGALGIDLAQTFLGVSDLAARSFGRVNYADDLHPFAERRLFNHAAHLSVADDEEFHGRPRGAVRTPVIGRTPRAGGAYG